MAEVETIIRRVILWVVAMSFVTGCVAHETRPLPKINATQGSRETSEDELLDVAVHTFEPVVLPEISKNEQALNKSRVYPDIRAAESRYVAIMLRDPLENCGQGGAVCVCPQHVQFDDVSVSSKIAESSGAKLALAVTVMDSTGRVWLDTRRYTISADAGSYKLDAARKAAIRFRTSIRRLRTTW